MLTDERVRVPAETALGNAAPRVLRLLVETQEELDEWLEALRTHGARP